MKDVSRGAQGTDFLPVLSSPAIDDLRRLRSNFFAVDGELILQWYESPIPRSTAMFVEFIEVGRLFDVKEESHWPEDVREIS